MILTCTLKTPLGAMQAAAHVADNAASDVSVRAELCGLWFLGQKHFPQHTDTWILQKDLPAFRELNKWLDMYFSKSKKLLHLPLAPKGTAFQQSVWKLLSCIPYGSTSTYSEIAGKLDLKGQGVRAVAGAVAHNPISIIIPCHRVIGSDGTLKGYAGGIDRKQALLKLEGFCTL